MAWGDRRRRREAALFWDEYVESLEHEYRRGPGNGRALIQSLRLSSHIYLLPWPMTRLGGMLYLLVLGIAWFVLFFMLMEPIGVLLSFVASTAAVSAVMLILHAKPPVDAAALQRRRDEAAAFQRYVESGGAHTGNSDTREASHG